MREYGCVLCYRHAYQYWQTQVDPGKPIYLHIRDKTNSSYAHFTHIFLLPFSFFAFLTRVRAYVSALFPFLASLHFSSLFSTVLFLYSSRSACDLAHVTKNPAWMPAFSRRNRNGTGVKSDGWHAQGGSVTDFSSPPCSSFCSLNTPTHFTNFHFFLKYYFIGIFELIDV